MGGWRECVLPPSITLGQGESWSIIWGLCGEDKSNGPLPEPWGFEECTLGRGNWLKGTLASFRLALQTLCWGSPGAALGWGQQDRQGATCQEAFPLTVVQVRGWHHRVYAFWNSVLWRPCLLHPSPGPVWHSDYWGMSCGRVSLTEV